MVGCDAEADEPPRCRQPLDQVDFPNLRARLRQNTVQEKLSAAYLERLLAAYPEGTGDVKALHDTIGEVAAYFRAHGECNFLLSNGDVLFAHCATNLGYLLPRAPFARALLAAWARRGRQPAPQ